MQCIQTVAMIVLAVSGLSNAFANSCTEVLQSHDEKIELDLKLVSSVARPLPVYWITTFSKKTGPNVAPMVAYAGLTHVPARNTLAVNPGRKSFANILETRELVLNVPYGTQESLDILWDTAWGGFRPGENKFTILGIETETSKQVQAPRIKNSLASIEFKVVDILYPSAEVNADRPILVLEAVAAAANPRYFDMTCAKFRGCAPIPLHFGGNLFLVAGEEMIAGGNLRREGTILNGQTYFNYISGKDVRHVSPELLQKLEEYRQSQ